VLNLSCLKKDMHFKCKIYCTSHDGICSYILFCDYIYNTFCFNRKNCVYWITIGNCMFGKILSVISFKRIFYNLQINISITTFIGIFYGCFIYLYSISLLFIVWYISSPSWQLKLSAFQFTHCILCFILRVRNCGTSKVLGITMVNMSKTVQRFI